MSTCLKRAGWGQDEGQEQVPGLLQHFSGAQSRTVMSGHMEDALGSEQCRDLVVEHELPMLTLEVWLGILVPILKQQYCYNSRKGGTVVFIQLGRGRILSEGTGGGKTQRAGELAVVVAGAGAESPPVALRGSRT